MNSEQRREYSRNYYKKNKERLLEKGRVWRANNRDKINETDRKRRKENPEMFKRIALKYLRTPKGMINKMFNSIQGRVKKPTRYKGRQLEFDREWFVDFASRSPELKKLHSDWVKSNYLRKMSPSVDRIDNDKGYTKNNIQFLTLSDNASKHTK